MAFLALIIAIIALVVSLRPRPEQTQGEVERRQSSRRKPTVCDDAMGAHLEARQAREREQNDAAPDR